jgi:RNA binding exosome subunit
MYSHRLRSVNRGEKVKKIFENVAELLKQNENLRNDDRPLIFEYWRRFDKTKLTLPAHPITNPATVIRVRAELQSEGYFLPTDPEVTTKRHKQKVKFREWLGYCSTGE